MTVTINGSTGIDKVQDGSIVQADLASNVVGTGPAFSAYNSTGTSVSTGVYTKIELQTEEFDTNSNFASNRFTPTVAGYYQLNAAVQIIGARNIAAAIYKNGTNYKQGTYISQASDQQSVAASLVYLNGSTDYAELYCFVGSGNSTTASGVANTYFNGFLARAA